MPAPPGTQLVCSSCGVNGHNKRSCGRRPIPAGTRRPTTKEDNLRKFYRLPYPEYLIMLEKGCGICGCDLHDRTPDVDHDHSCAHADKGSASCRACVRGVLCRSCNLRVGHFERGVRDDAEIGSYLGRTPTISSSMQAVLF